MLSAPATQPGTSIILIDHLILNNLRIAEIAAWPTKEGSFGSLGGNSATLLRFRLGVHHGAEQQSQYEY